MQHRLGLLLLQPFVESLIQQPGIVAMPQNPHWPATGASATSGNVVNASRHTSDGLEFGQGQPRQAIAGVYGKYGHRGQRKPTPGVGKESSTKEECQPYAFCNVLVIGAST